MKMNNPYVRFYLDQQGRGMPVFRGSAWQMGHGQKRYGLGGLFRSVARSVMPLVKSGAKALGNIALNSGANFVNDVLAGKKSSKQQKLVLWRVSTQQRRKRHSGCRGLPKLGRDARERGQEVPDDQPNAQVERERHPHRQPGP